MNKTFSKNARYICNLSMILGSFLMLYYLLLTIIYHYVSFSLVLGCFGFCLFLFGYLQKHYHVFIYSLFKRPLQILILGSLSLSLLIFTIAEGFILFYGHSKTDKDIDVILVLGAGLNGNKISSTLAYRLDTALQAHLRYPDKKIIVSGGKGDKETISESQAMASYLIKHGVPKQQIIKESRSTNTYENFYFSKKLLSKKSDKVLVITNNFHMLRAMMLAKKTGLHAFRYPSPDHFPTSLNFHIREFFGLMKDIIIH